jgi:hypothetical protein
LGSKSALSQHLSAASILFYQIDDKTFALLVHDGAAAEEIALNDLLDKYFGDHDLLETIKIPQGEGNIIKVSIPEKMAKCIVLASKHLKSTSPSKNEKKKSRVKRYFRRFSGYGMAKDAFTGEYSRSKAIWSIPFDVVKYCFSRNNRNINPSPENWDEAVNLYNLSDSDIKDKYKKRRLLAFFLIILFILSLFVLLKTTGALVLAIIVSLLIFMYYIKSVFEMHQIRSKKIMKLSVFLKHGIANPAVFVPLPYPASRNKETALKKEVNK